MPVFENILQDVAWLPNGEQFIVISGNQPSTSTLYDKNCKPLFEFGKRYRNTVRICPFSQLALIGGFGNLKGNFDLWRLDKLEDVGSAKADCAITIDWSPDGQNIMTAVLYERVKVDNQINLFSGCGNKEVKGGHQFKQLDYAAWQPSPPGTYKKPDIDTMRQASEG